MAATTDSWGCWRPGLGCKDRPSLSVYRVAWEEIKLVKGAMEITNQFYSPLRTVATAQAYFHVFFYEQQQRQGDAGFGGGESKRCQYPPMDIALTALLVASKAEETYKKIRAILSAAFLELNPSFSGTDVDVNVRRTDEMLGGSYPH